MATNTYMTYLMHSDDGTTWLKLVDIKEFPDLGSAAPTLDTTTLSDNMHTYIDDIQDTGGGLEFNSNYDKDDYATLKALEGKEEHYGVWFGGKETSGVVTPDGSLGKWQFKGKLNVWPKGGSVGAVRDMGISIAPSTEIKSVA